MSDNEESLIDYRNRVLNSISDSFCAAKWYNASIHLGHGYTGSCHLPLPHPIDEEEIKTNPSAIHNTAHKKKMRKMMLEGVRPAECSYCWKIEDIKSDQVSDRVYKSEIYKEEDISKLKDLPYDVDVNLKTLEVSFDRQCNFACSYCNAGFSSTWANDLEKNGPYQNFIASSGGGGAYQSDGKWAELKGRHLENNPFTDAFFRWWPELSKELEELRITGGEPTVSQNFWHFIDILKQNPAPKLRFAVNSNLGLSKKGLSNLIEMTHQLPVKEIDLYTSNESYGKQAEYIRDGLDYEVWRSNLKEILGTAKYRSMTIMMTINSLCFFSIDKFLDDMMELKKEFGHHRPSLSFNILRWPNFMSPLSMPNDYKFLMHNILGNWYEKNCSSELLNSGEKAQIERLLEYIKNVDKGHLYTPDDKKALYHDFKSFYTQYDQRRGKNFVETFPELKDWYNSINVRKVFNLAPMHSQGINHYEDGIYKNE
jgi:organic radical activating enzyme